MDMPDFSQDEMAEMMKLLEQYESSAKAFGPVPEELQELMNNVKKAKGQPTADAVAEEIVPEPGFVVKTTDQDGKKVFINMCHSKQVPTPGGWKNGAMPDTVLKALDDLQRDQPSQSAETLRFPLSCSEVLPDTDKAGQPCSTVDCILHSDVLAAAQQHRQLKAFLVELALEWVGNKHKMQLDPKFKLPKMTYKGSTVRPQRVRMDRKPLVEDVTLQQLQQDDTPSFPLITSKQEAAKVASKAVEAGSKQSPAADKQQGEQQLAGAGSQSSKQDSRCLSGQASAGVKSVSTSSSQWQHTVICEGKPATQMVVTVQLPKLGDHDNSSSNSEASWSAFSIIVEVCGSQLRCTATDALADEPYVVQLPFAASSEGAVAQLQASSGQLQVRLPYLPLQHWVKQLQEQSPHVFSTLPVAHANYMELDE